MVSMWMPGAEKSPSIGGSMEGQNYKSVVWHTSESGHTAGTIDGVAKWVKQQSSEYNLLWNPWTGELVQLIAADRSGRALKNAAGNYRTNRKGVIRLQVCVIGRVTDRPLAGGSPMKKADYVMAWIRELGVPDKVNTSTTRQKSDWEKSGHTTHRWAPGNDHYDPGLVDWDDLFKYGRVQGLEPDPEIPNQIETEMEDDDMFIGRQGSRYILVASGWTARITEDTAESLNKIGIKTAGLSIDSFTNISDVEKERQNVSLVGVPDVNIVGVPSGFIKDGLNGPVEEVDGVE